MSSCRSILNRCDWALDLVALSDTSSSYHDDADLSSISRDAKHNTTKHHTAQHDTRHSQRVQYQPK